MDFASHSAGKAMDEPALGRSGIVTEPASDGAQAGSHRHRERKGPTFVRQVRHPLHWLRRMLSLKGCGCSDTNLKPLVRTYRWDASPRVVRVETDAFFNGLRRRPFRE